MPGMNFIITREDWSLHRKGEIDRQRHQEKVREAIKKNLADIVSEESIIMHDGRKVVRSPSGPLMNITSALIPASRSTGAGRGQKQAGRRHLLGTAEGAG